MDLLLPRFVVTEITPLLPLIPYIANAAASFITETDSISSRESVFIGRSKPSTMTKGERPLS